MSRSKALDRITTEGSDEPEVTTVRVGVCGDGERAGELDAAAVHADVDVAVAEPEAPVIPVAEPEAPVVAEPDAPVVPVAEPDDVPMGARGGGAKVAGRSGAVGASVRWLGGVPLDSPRWASQAARVGARSSTAQASRCRSIDRCESQQATEQNTRRVRSRLQVETLHTQ